MIREISPEDAAQLVPLNTLVQNLHAAECPHIYPADPDPAALAAHLAATLARPGTFALAWGAPPLGYVLAEVQEIPGDLLRHPARRGMVHHISVAATARRQGIGLALVEAAKARFRDAGATHWAVTYRVFNDASAALMARAGAAPGLILGEGAL
ncbi:GNAT family N-acetyltransferase [Acidimangrovimonas sediminis]|uniref:GNAT family N-acetyltransferase n=1 Tax=Acidimangrovimonas sediminis TaxID=2056283 RepID=UPI001304FBC9|nr:GNAT family N-acetyltransferase [Acidimangrovimonas sediminis]